MFRLLGEMANGKEYLACMMVAIIMRLFQTPKGLAGLIFDGAD